MKVFAHVTANSVQITVPQVEGSTMKVLIVRALQANFDELHLLLQFFGKRP